MILGRSTPLRRPPILGRGCDFEKVSDLWKASDLGKVNNLGKASDFGKVSDLDKATYLSLSTTVFQDHLRSNFGHFQGHLSESVKGIR